MTDKKYNVEAEENPSELADLIDRLMESGSGHINIRADGTEGFNVQTVKSTDCCGVKGACCQPTEFADEDDDDYY
ncbi:MAG: hypothetical protein IKM49_00800 [Ruminococcus sp.]|nr:hypothetical protein [Ruminococcus sp.]MBR6791646.1 hypothetical protein [Ruminococcus sp.]